MEKIILNKEQEKKNDLVDKGVYQLFEEQVLLRPNNIALICKDEKITFFELNSKINKMARCLLQRGVKEGDVVAVLMDKSIELIVSIFALVKIGATYLPLDINYPDERLNYIFNDAEIALIILKDRSFNRKGFEQEKLFYAAERICDSEISDTNFEVPYKAKNSIYVIYTSGSTGKPKGVKIKSCSFANLVKWYIKEFTISSNDIGLLFTSISFDLTQKNIFSVLISGGTLCIYHHNSYHPRLICEMINTYKVTMVNCTPSASLPLLNFCKDSNYSKLKSVNWLFLGGEPINVKPFLEWMDSDNSNCKIVNTYGPTECTDVAAFFVIDKENKNRISTVPIGKAISNVNIFLIDENNKVVEDSGVGEIYIGGAGVGLGYIKQDKLLNEKFIVIPSLSSEKIYKTGDIAKRLEDGNLEYIGRVDNQVKYHGYRIELEEIEKCINQYTSVNQSVVQISNIYDNEKEKILEAFYTADFEINTDEILEFLAKHLPNYMIPVKFSRVKEFPLSNNGKIDRKRIGEVIENIKMDVSNEEIVCNQQSELTCTEKKTLEIFENVVKENVTIAINLFTLLTEMALDSLALMRIIVQLEETFGVEFDDEMLEIENFSDIASVVRYINSKK